MSAAAITVQHLSKAYRIGQKEEVHDTLTGAMLSWARAPLRNFRRLQRLNTFDASGDSVEPDVLWSLKDISFEVQPGEVVGIIGRNGAGKSTLLKILSRITRPTSGRAVIRGRVSSLLEVGTGFHPELTGRENIYMNGTILGMRKREIDRKFDEIVEFSGVEKFLDTPVKRYSSGMKVRLAFAVAAHLEPEILIIDEVLAVGDFEFQKKCLGKMNDVATSGRTVLFVSHNLTAVARLCTRAIVLKEGRITHDGDTQGGVSRHVEQLRRPERTWQESRDRPGSEVVQLTGVRVQNAVGEIVETIDVGDAIRIEFEYEVLEPGHVLVPNAHVYIADGTCAFVSHDVDPGWQGRAKPRGTYCSALEIPGNFFNEGWFTIGAAISTYRPFRVHCFEREAVSVEVTESNTHGLARGDYAGTIPGIFRPLFPWSTTQS